MNLNKIFFISFILIIFSLDSFAGNKNLKQIIMEDESLSSGNVGFISLDDKKYIVSVGVGDIKGKGKKAVLKARKVARANAERGLNEFINGVESQVLEEFKSKVTTKTVTKDGEVIEETEEETEEYFEYIREKGAGLISGAETAGKWKSEDKTEYYYALTIEMK